MRDDSFDDVVEAESTRSGGMKLRYMPVQGNILHDSLPSYFAIHLAGALELNLHKGKWSKFLMRAIGGMILFQSGLHLLVVGLGWLEFTSYDWLLPVLLVQYLGQIVGLALYAVRYLFSDISDQIPEPAINIKGNSS